MSKKPQTKQMRRDPITGKMVPFDRSERAAEIARRRAEIRKDELRNGNVTAPDVEPMFDDTSQGNQRTVAVVSQELSDLRQKWVSIGPEKRAGGTGNKLSSKYRRLALEFWHMTGKHPPAIYADL